MIPASTLDRCVLRILELVETDELDVERLLRMGAHGEVSGARALKRLGLDRSNTYGQFRRMGVPSPYTLLMWGRLLTAMHAWEPTRRAGRGAVVSLESVALTHRWSAQTQISLSLRRFAGVYPRAWHLDGASLDHLCDLFVAKWRERVEVAA